MATFKGLINAVWKMTADMKMNAKRNRIEQKIKRVIESQLDELGRKLENEMDKRESMITEESLFALDSDKTTFDLNEFREVRVRIKKLEDNIRDIQEIQAELFSETVEVKDEAEDCDTIQVDR